MPLLSGQQTKQIQELIDLLKKNNLTEMELEREGLRIRVRHETGLRTMTATVQEQGTPRSTSATYEPATAGTLIEDTTGMITIASPIVGTFYRSPSPESAAFVEIGQKVRKGQVVCIVEAMKLMNEIEAETDGVVAEILAQNAEHVEYGQHLLRLAKA